MELINRQDVIDMINRHADGYSYVESPTESLIRDTMALPTVEPKRGKWIDYCGDLKCDQCGCEADLFGIRGEWNYCPNCGARMED